MRTTASQAYGGAQYRERQSRDALSNNIRVAIPGIIQEFRPADCTATVQPAIKEVLYNTDGVATPVSIPDLLDVPVIMPHAGGYAITLPVHPGDECLVLFADMCIDAWWQSGGVQTQVELRRHDLSDGFALLGPWSVPNCPEYNQNQLAIYHIESGNGITVTAEKTSVVGRLEITNNLKVRGDMEVLGDIYYHGSIEKIGDDEPNEEVLP